jgi:hypothetical protein
MGLFNLGAASVNKGQGFSRLFRAPMDTADARSLCSPQIYTLSDNISLSLSTPPPPFSSSISNYKGFFPSSTYDSFISVNAVLFVQNIYAFIFESLYLCNIMSGKSPKTPPFGGSIDKIGGKGKQKEI